MKERKNLIGFASLVIGIIIGIISILFSAGVSAEMIVAYSLLMVIISIQSAWFYSWYQNKDSMFKKEETKKRNRAYKLINEVKLTLHTTHFSKSIPPSDYTSKVIEKLKAGVDVYRIIDKKILTDKATQAWLEQFKEFTNYHQLETDKDLPFDISVFDNKKAILYFPGHPMADDFDMSLYINNEQLAHIFMMVFSKIKSVEPAHMKSSTPKNSKSWLKDAYHMPYLVIEGLVSNEHNIDIDEKLSLIYRKIDLNNIGNTYALDDNNKLVFCVDNNKCALCYYLNHEATDMSSHTDIVTEAMMTFDKKILTLQNTLVDIGIKLEVNKLYLEDPSRGLN